MTHSNLVFRTYFHNYFLSCYKQKSSLTYRNLKGFTWLPKEHGQTGREGVKENRNRSQGFTEYFSFHCLSSFVVVVTVVVFTFFLFLNKYMHTQTPFICLLLNCLWLHWGLLSIRYSRKNPAKAHLTRSKLDFIFLLNDGLPSSPCLWASGELTGWYWLFNYVCSFFGPGQKYEQVLLEVKCLKPVTLLPAAYRISSNL